MRRRAFTLFALAIVVLVTVLAGGVVADRKSDDGFDVIHDDDVREPELASEPAPELFFIYLTRDPNRTMEKAKGISSGWATMLRSAGESAELFAIDETMFACRASSEYVQEYIKFFLDQSETHYIDIKGQKVYRKGTEDMQPAAAAATRKDVEEKNTRKERKAKKKTKKKKASKTEEL